MSQVLGSLPGASTRLLRKGILIGETYQIMRDWNSGTSIRKNLEKASQVNSFGAANTAWLREVLVTFSSRFKSEDIVAPLVVLAKSEMSIQEWTWFLLWQTQRTDGLFFRFILDWLFPHYEERVQNIRAEQVAPYFREMISVVAGEAKKISEYGVVRGARDLLRMASCFGLVEGRSSKHFKLTHIPERAFFWALHELYAEAPNALKIIHDPRWRLFLLSPSSVEREILRLHQFRKLDYQTAGSLSQLELPFSSGSGYLRSITHE